MSDPIDPANHPRQPAAEPEIIPPGHAGPRPADMGGNVWTASAARGSYRIYVGKPGPLTFLLVLIGLGAAAAIVIFLLLGLFIFWVPVLAVLLFGIVLARMIGGPPRRP